MVRGIKWGLKPVLTLNILPLSSTHLSIISDVGGSETKGSEREGRGEAACEELKFCCGGSVREKRWIYENVKMSVVN
jgi:hypothetical protein